MKPKVIASTLGIFALISSGAFIPFETAHAVIFNPPPDQSAPSTTAGGASRSNGSLFAPKPDQSAPSRTAGGASRNGSLFAPKPDQSAPSTTAGGASRSNGSLFAPKPDQSAPKQTAGGSSREGDKYLSISENSIEQPGVILALLPKAYFGTTISQNPKILVYLPASPARKGIFSLKDAQGNTLHQMNVSVSGKAEVISIKVPINLQFEKNYQWFFALQVDQTLSPRTPYVNGWIQRIQPDEKIIKSMQQKDLLKQAKAFGQGGVWYDCIATLAKLRDIQPTNPSVNKHWSELLASVRLKQIGKAPLVVVNNI
ncbi:MAG: DUF928 domain-containing protein [Cyanobacteria bacterium P01_A01_bin.45]